MLQERTGDNQFEHGSLMLQYKLDNEFELVFVAGYQKILKLSYVDKFLDDIQREIRDRFRTQLADRRLHANGLAIEKVYAQVLREAEVWGFEVAKQPKAMRSFEESRKSKKTVASMIDRPGDKPQEKKNAKSKKQESNKNAIQNINDVNENEENEVPDQEEEDPEEIQPEVDFKMPKITPKGVQRKPGPGKFQ